MNETSVRTYLNFSKVIDPARILTMADLELSVALASPLVTFNDQRQVVSGLAERWTITTPKKIRFVLRADLRWSDGTPVTAAQYKAALERAKKDFGDDLKALFDTIEEIEAVDSVTLQFTTKEDVTSSGLLLKLTEPMYGLVSIKNGALDLSKSAGPFVLDKVSESEITLQANRHWYAYDPAMPATIVIRRPSQGLDSIEAFQKDPWANLMSSTSLMPKQTETTLQELGYKTWQRTLDKVFSLYPSKRMLEVGGAEFMRELAAKIKAEDLLKDLTGFTKAEQFFPRGYELWSSAPPRLTASKIIQIPKKLLIIIPDNALAGIIHEKLQKTLSSVGPTKVLVEKVPMAMLNERMKRGDFDVLATAIAVADPNFEGAMSFFFERKPAFIQSGKGAQNFADQLRIARGLGTSKERAARMREIIISAQEAGHVIPVFHFSSLGIAKLGVDLSNVPNSDETILFSKVRLK